MELEKEHPNTKLEDREFEMMILYSAGYTAEQIAKMLHKAPKTIETYLFRVKQKFHFKNRIEMKRYLKGKGYEGLEEFFFNYFPDKPHNSKNIQFKIK